MARRTDLVFRTIGERTAKMALRLAIDHIRPSRVEVIDGLRPLSAAVERQLELRHDADQVVYVDADCLILEDLVPFLETNDRAYVDCYVTDRFRGRIHCGVHITRVDVVRTMASLSPPRSDRTYVLRPESRLRNLAMGELGTTKELRNFQILHDHFQFYRDIFYKYALRELRSRTPHQHARLRDAVSGWIDSELDRDVQVARMAIQHARTSVSMVASAEEISRYIDVLPEIARVELALAGVEEKGPLGASELAAWLERHPVKDYSIAGRPRVFGIGLSRTGTRSLTAALHILGWDTIHYPADARTFEQISNADLDLDILQRYHGVTDITVAPYFAQIDRRFPGSKFIMTVRERESWLRSCSNHWLDRPAFAEPETPERVTYMKMRRLLRAAVYGCYGFDEERFAWAYEQHLRMVREYFQDRPRDLLELDVCVGMGWQPLCEFLDQPLPNQPFPHKGSTLSKKLNQVLQHAEDETSEITSTAPATEAFDSDDDDSHSPVEASKRSF